MVDKKRLNIQVKEKLVLKLKEVSVQLSQKRNRMVAMQSLADEAISNVIKKYKKEVE